MTRRTPRLDPARVRALRITRSGLARPFATAVQAARALVGVQAQLLPAAFLALWNRTRSAPDHAALARALYDERVLVKLWGQRHTLHLYAIEDWPVLHGAFAGRATWFERSVVAQGGDAAAYRRTIARVSALLRERGVLGRSALRASGIPLDAHALSAWGGVFADLVRRGEACHGPVVEGEPCFAHREHWLPGLAWEPSPRDEAGRALALRYLHAYGPANAQDLAYWLGCPTADARRFLAALGKDACDAELEGRDVFALARDLDALAPARRAPETTHPLHLLYRFDPLLLAHRDKSWVVPDAHHARVWRPAGHIEGVVLARGEAVATWRYERRGRSLEVSVRPFARGALDRDARRAVEARAAEIEGFFGLDAGGVRYGR